MIIPEPKLDPKESSGAWPRCDRSAFPSAVQTPCDLDLWPFPPPIKTAHLVLFSSQKLANVREQTILIRIFLIHPCCKCSTYYSFFAHYFLLFFSPLLRRGAFPCGKLRHPTKELTRLKFKLTLFKARSTLLDL